MRRLPLLPLIAALSACGSNVPPTPEQQPGGMSHPPTAMTGDQDRDFATMMITHHQGAIDMARQELSRGRDPEMRALAAKVIADQQREITQMQGWLERRGGAAGLPAQ
ncbi:DUF305 domain-containing protein [Sphingomonas sp. BN140010]|uniref:DUF305 domain-containing protein n=1 Tax=Sphingomonas arvum TaxID=2992113 RepID=A0ABT3JFZ5_9SPHN|nr:DUF305 domain-containing protein [Sphingomonas sp. BN140010]MCW3797990.1 DUF305 domain-containing protein [Sphingomonas sp. BN140010]